MTKKKKKQEGKGKNIDKNIFGNDESKFFNDVENPDNAAILIKYNEQASNEFIHEAR